MAGEPTFSEVFWRTTDKEEQQWGWIILGVGIVLLIASMIFYYSVAH